MCNDEWSMPKEHSTAPEQWCLSKVSWIGDRKDDMLSRIWCYGTNFSADILLFCFIKVFDQGSLVWYCNAFPESWHRLHWLKILGLMSHDMYVHVGQWVVSKRQNVLYMKKCPKCMHEKVPSLSLYCSRTVIIEDGQRPNCRLQIKNKNKINI